MWWGPDGLILVWTVERERGGGDVRSSDKLIRMI